MFWAQYYITPGRLKKSLFTSPVISDVGISMVMKPPVKGMWDKSFELIIVPFTGTVRLEQLIIPWPELPSSPQSVCPNAHLLLATGARCGAFRL